MKLLYLPLTIFVIINLASAFYQLPLSPLNYHNVKSTSNLSPRRPLVTKYHRQRINHFNEFDTRVFNQRYYEDRHFFKAGGPIFLFIDYQIEAFPLLIERGPINDLAQIHNGMIVYLENRFMGKSWPFNDTSIENLKFLSVDQIVEDLKHFIETVKQSDEDLAKSKVIVIGIGVSASIVSWFRVRYPEMSAGAWASSGFVEPKADFPEYRVELADIYKRFGGQKCYDKIKLGFLDIERDLMNGDIFQIDRYLNICEGFNVKNEKDRKYLIYILANLFVAVNTVSDTDYIAYSCKRMINIENNIEAIAVGLEYFISPTVCTTAKYSSAVETLKRLDDPLGFRQMAYMSCYQYGIWMSNEAKNQPFGTMVKFDDFMDFCRDVFDDSFTKEILIDNVQKLNDKYGGLNANFTNLYSTQGFNDPAKILGLNKNVGPSAITEVIAGQNQASDFLQTYLETGPINKARLQGKLLITKWLNE